jgi:RNase P subunit RPR2
MSSGTFDSAGKKEGPNADDTGARTMADTTDDEEVKMTVRLPKSMKERFKRRCKQEGVNMSVVVRRFVRRVLNGDVDLL